MKNNNRFLIILFSIVFVVYNTLLFMLFGFANHTPTFWLSYTFMLISIIGGFGVLIAVSKANFILKDWFLGYPIIKHSVFYIAFELVASIIFAIFENSVKWQISFIIQFLGLGVVATLVLSSFFVKDKVDAVRSNVFNSTNYIKSLKTDAELLVSKCDDAQLKEELKAFYEAIKYSDPVSNEKLSDIEQELGMAIRDCKQALSLKDFSEAKRLCNLASELLEERNKKCKELKASIYT